MRTIKFSKEDNYKTVQANGYIGTEEGNLYIKAKEDAEVRVTKVSQLDRLEKKADRILELLEGQKLSTSVELDMESLKKVTQDLDDRYNEKLRICNLI